MDLNYQDNSQEVPEQEQSEETNSCYGMYKVGSWTMPLMLF
jgi:hypothetical protein